MVFQWCQDWWDPLIELQCRPICNHISAVARRTGKSTNFRRFGYVKISLDLHWIFVFFFLKKLTCVTNCASRPSRCFENPGFALNRPAALEAFSGSWSTASISSCQDYESLDCRKSGAWNCTVQYHETCDDHNIHDGQVNACTALSFRDSVPSQWHALKHLSYYGILSCFNLKAKSCLWP